jgi:hypothetical protein
VLASNAGTAFAAGSAGVILTSVTAGAGDPNGKVPAINAVPGAGVANADLSFPLAILTHGSAYYIQMTSQNTTFNGTCENSYKLTQVQSGKTVTLLSGKTSPYSCAPGTVWAWYLGSKAVPDAPGEATLTGTVSAGKNKVSLKIPVEIQ